MNAETDTKPRLHHRAWNWLKGFVLRHKIISALVLLYLVSKAITTPIINPFASDVYTIRGRFPFDKGFSLSFNQHAYANALWLRQWCGWPLADEGSCAGGTHWMEPTRIGKDHYELKVYRDRYFFWIGDWKEHTNFLAYVSSTAANRETMLRTSYANDASSVCDDSEEFMKKFNGKLYCTSQFRHKDFKHLHLTDGQPVQANERLINFWLERELTPMLDTHKPGTQP